MTEGTGEELIAVGRITGAHGIRGEVKVLSLTDYPERFDADNTLLLQSPDGSIRTVRIESSRFHKDRFLLGLEGVTDRNGAEDLKGSSLVIREEDLTPLPPGKYYHHQLVGLKVVTDEGVDLGRVDKVFPTGSNLVLVVRQGKREVLLPYIDDVVKNVDTDGNIMEVHLLEGLLPEN